MLPAAASAAAPAPPPPAAPPAAPAAVTTAAAPAATTTAATRALLRLVDVDGATVDVTAVELLDRVRGFLVRAHLDEGEAAGAARLAVHDHLGVGDGAELPEELAKAHLGRVVRKVSNIEASTHLRFSRVVRFDGNCRHPGASTVPIDDLARSAARLHRRDQTGNEKGSARCLPQNRGRRKRGGPPAAKSEGW